MSCSHYGKAAWNGDKLKKIRREQRANMVANMVAGLIRPE